jgi:FkbM family methyltransferase
MDFPDTPMPTEEALDIAESLIHAGKFQEAESVLAKVLAVYPDRARAHWLAGKMYGYQEKIELAHQRYSKAIAIDGRFSAVEFKVDGKLIKLSDTHGSRAPVLVMLELYEDAYGVRRKILRDGDIIVDVGANIGGFSIPVALFNPGVRIIAFEPHPVTYKHLVINLNDNNVTNVTAVQSAISAFGDSLELLWYPGNSGAATAFMPEKRIPWCEQGGWKRCVVPSMSLDAVFSAHQIEACRWLKMDCEGAEIDLLKVSDCLGRVHTMSLELHMPASEVLALGEQKAKREIMESLNRFPHPPLVEICSFLALLDAPPA